MKASGFKLQVSDRTDSRSGQALVEVIVGIVVVMVLVSGLLQLAIMSAAHTDAMAEARAEVAELSMLDLGPGLDLLSNPKFIKDWDEGPDGRRLSRDDDHTIGDTAGFSDVILARTVTDASGWEQIDRSANNRITKLHDDPGVINAFGLVKGSATESAKLSMVPFFRRYIYASDTIDVEATVWMTQCKGLY